jgi:tetraacyldisaccharide 4'-kinase
MPPKTPALWNKQNLIAQIMRPVSWLYYFGHRINIALANPYKSPVPVLCIGGVTAGGSGKTPVLHAVLDLLRTRLGYTNPVILTRGYGGAMKGPTLVEPGYHDADNVGDEALIHASRAPTIIARDRAAGARAAQAMGADIILLDDGLQNKSLSKTASLLVLDTIGNGLLLPAGPLREPFADALIKSSCIVQTGADSVQISKPVFKTMLKIISTHDMGKSYFAFAGLGRPEKFRKTLEDSGFHLSGFSAFADHHSYTESDLDMLYQRAGDSTLITTEKDWLKLKNKAIECMRISYVFEDEAGLASHLESVLRKP